jgi:hypothetical protein
LSITSSKNSTMAKKSTWLHQYRIYNYTAGLIRDQDFFSYCVQLVYKLFFVNWHDPFNSLHVLLQKITITLQMVCSAYYRHVTNIQKIILLTFFISKTSMCSMQRSEWTYHVINNFYV